MPVHEEQGANNSYGNSRCTSRFQNWIRRRDFPGSRPAEYACANKVRYGTWSAAKHDARHLHQRTGEIVRPYRCHSCGAYHLGHGIAQRVKRSLVHPPSRERLRQGMCRVYWLLAKPAIISAEQGLPA